MKIAVRNPRTGVDDYWFEAPQADALDVIGAHLRKQQPEWEAAGALARVETLGDWAQQIADRRDELTAALVADTGRLHESILEVDAVLRFIERWRTLAPQLLAPTPRLASPSLPFIQIGAAHRAYSLVGIISPWNFPLLLSMIDAVPALSAGSAVIVKPSEITPRFIEPLMKTIAAVPALAAVLSVVAGDGGTGAAIIDRVDAVCFTGSVATGRVVGEQAARRFIPAFLELGGKDPAIVLASADIDRTASALLWGSTANAGQACQSIERIYVDTAIAAEFVDALVTKAAAVPLAFPEPIDGRIGPIIATRQIQIIDEHLRDAATKGARTMTGGDIEILGGGAYLRPTVLTDVDHSMRVMTEETFGPVMPVMTFGGIEQAVALANHSTYGLSAAIFAATTDEATTVAARIDAGAISINDASLTAFVSDGEKHSFKMSGLGGSRMGPASLHRFLRSQALLINANTAPDPWWY